jgi:transcriptional regulator with XRE-family HTH domain
MKEKGYNQVRLAEKTGLKSNTISAWLRGVKEPSITSLWLLADCFNVDVDYIIGRKDY